MSRRSGGEVRRVVLLDRDGVLNLDRPGSVTSVAELRLIPGAREAAALLARTGYTLVVVTNQACVGRGLLSLPELARINAELNDQLGGLVSDWFVCPHTAAEGCDCRKPATRLFELAQQVWRFDTGSTWFVADDRRDVEAARRFGCRPALVRTGKGAATAAQLGDVPVFDDLGDFASWLTGSGHSNHGQIDR